MEAGDPLFNIRLFLEKKDGFGVETYFWSLSASYFRSLAMAILGAVLR